MEKYIKMPGPIYTSGATVPLTYSMHGSFLPLKVYMYPDTTIISIPNNIYQFSTLKVLLF
jgi:hypothetical protein